MAAERFHAGYCILDKGLRDMRIAFNKELEYINNGGGSQAITPDYINIITGAISSYTQPAGEACNTATLFLNQPTAADALVYRVITHMAADYSIPGNLNVWYDNCQNTGYDNFTDYAIKEDDNLLRRIELQE